MGFKHITHILNKNGLKETQTQEYAKDSILLGRGAACDVRLLGKRVSLNHAQLSIREDRLFVDDMESLSGIRVNLSIAPKAELKVGDELSIGKYTFTIKKEGEQWCLVESRGDEEDDSDLEALVAAQSSKLDYKKQLPSLTTLSTVFALTVLGGYFVLPFFNLNRSSWNSGPISNPHKMIENDCSQCHSSAFVQVQDQQCVSCHQMTEHADTYTDLLEAHPSHELRCAQCHMEHNGDAGLIVNESARCAECHGNIENLLPKDKVEVVNVSNFESHPEFRIRVKNESGEVVRKQLSKTSMDGTQIKLNHKIHLQPDIAGAQGPETLTCYDCHRLTEDMREFKPISFESDCQSCHPLEFDPRLPGKSVPHGDAEMVYNYLYAEYAKLFLGEEGKKAEVFEAEFRRRKPGKSVTREEELEFTRTAVESQARSVEESMFNRTACHLCHMVTRSDAGVSVDGKDGVEVESVSEEAGGTAVQLAKSDKVVVKGSMFKIDPPEIPTRWFSASGFDHGAHQEISCTSCHQGVRESEVTSDLLLPGIANCRQCHGEQSKKGMVRADCITCHSFHDPALMDEDRKRDIEKILLSYDKTPLG